MPVSKTSVLGARSANAGGARWIGRRSVAVDRAALVDRVAEQVEHAAEARLADRDRDRRARVDDVLAADHAVGRAERHRPHASAAEVLLHLADEALLAAVRCAIVELEGVVDAREGVLGELRVERGSDDLRDLAEGVHVDSRRACVACVGREAGCVGGDGGVAWGGGVGYSRAAAPPMISVSSVVIWDWRLRLNRRPSALIMSFALSVAPSWPSCGRPARTRRRRGTPGRCAAARSAG